VLGAARAERPATASQTPSRVAGVAISPRTDEHASWRTRLLPRITGPAWGTAIAALLVVALLGGVAGGRLQQLASGTSGDSLAGVVGTVERVLESPSHRVVSLRSASGAAAGSVAWSQQDFAVLTSALTPPPAGEVYRCWLAWGDQAATIGEMDFAGSTAYWTGTTGSWASVTFEPGTRFLVTLEPAASPPPGAGPGPVILQADLSA
jgi:hypothetical protein